MRERAAVVVASNRGPVTVDAGPDGAPVVRRGSGGLVTALTASLHERCGSWIAAAMTEGDRAIARGEVAADLPFRVRFLDLPAEDYDGYYNGVANGILWFAHHSLWDTVRSPTFDDGVDRLWDAYERVNAAFARALAEEAGRLPGRPAYLVQDYHLALVPAMLRALDPDARIAHFSHTPFAPPTTLRILPTRVADRLLLGMLGADVLGFHARAWAEHFLLDARTLPGVHADPTRGRVLVDGREVRTRIHPISIDARALRREADDGDIAARRASIERWRGDRALILRVDRLELSKNIVRGFRAFERFLERNPTMRGTVVFLAMLSPSRLDIAAYRTYAEECVAEAERVNRAFGTADWTPIAMRIREDYAGALAAYALYDVLLVNPVVDGMNLVAMEGPVLNRRNGALVLSRNAGASARLGRHALGVNPFDIEETAAAIERGLAMGRAERARLARGLRRLLLSNPPERWLTAQLDDLLTVERRRTRLAMAG